MKPLRVGLLMLLVCSLIFSGSVWANEGVVGLGSENGGNGSCFAVSIYVEGRYRILMSCRGLRSAFDSVRNKYLVWAVSGQNVKRLGEIKDGKMQISTDGEFDKLEVTAERDNYLNKPEGKVLLAGTLEELVFQGIIMEKEEVVDKINDREAITPTPVSKGAESGVSVFKVLGKVLLTGFGMLIIVVGFLSYLSRKKK